MTDDLQTDIPVASNKRADSIRIISMVLAAIGAFVLLTYRNYLDIGQIPLAILYFASVFVVYHAHKQDKLPLASLFTFLAIVLISLTVIKVFWNKNYLQSLTTPDAFVMEDYIDSYPRWEEHLLAGLLGKKDWVRFSEDCVAPALRGLAPQPMCASVAAIQQRYRLDVNVEIDHFLRRMQKTAIDINGSRIRSGSDYQRCVGNRQCAPIPLLPANVDAKSLEGNTSDHLEVRTAFWDLADEKGLTPAVCEAMILCRAMVASKVITLPSIKTAGGITSTKEPDPALAQ